MFPKKFVKKVLQTLQKKVIVPVYVPISKGELLLNRVILVTGGTGGIGFEIAKTCLDNSAIVIITGRNEERLAIAKEKLLKEDVVLQDRIITQVVDVKAIDSFESVIESIQRKLGDKKIDTLINNAGIANGAQFGKTDEMDFESTINTNLKGTYFLSQTISDYFIRNKIQGNILNISSVSGIRPAVSPYMCSKWAITGLTEGMAKKLIRHGIVVNGIAPGPTTTDMIKSNQEDIYYAKSPAERYIVPKEVANLALFMISGAGRMIVGDTIYITGGCGNLTVDDISY